LHTPNPYKRAINTYPVVLFVTITLNLFFVLNKAGVNNSWIKANGYKFSLPVSFGGGALSVIIFLIFFAPRLRRNVDDDVANNAPGTEILRTTDEANKRREMQNSDEIDKTARDEQADEEAAPVEESLKSKSITEKIGGLAKSFAKNTFDQDLQARSMHDSERAQEIWDKREVFDAHAERMFTYLQVFTVCLDSFAHGANDVANAIAPVSAVYLIYTTGSVESKAPVQKWALALGGAGIVVGLLLFGYRVMMTLGFQLTAVTPSRGFCIELSTALIVVIASFIGIPISTTQCQVGATAGAGLVGGSANLDFWLLFTCMFSWVATFLAVVILNAGVFAFGFFAPSAAGFA